MNTSAAWAGLAPVGIGLGLLPLALLLAGVALLPVLPASAAWWAKDRHKLGLSAAVAAIGVLQYLVVARDWAGVAHSYLDYLAFVAMLGSLYVITGGIHIRFGFKNSPAANTGILALGAVLSNLLGTTGASLLLIRPLLRSNRGRRHASHLVVFFIFIVSNCGGLLTPLGDPPLYLGFLGGVPFAWNLRMTGPWALVNGCLLLVFYLLDRRSFGHEGPAAREALTASLDEGRGLRLLGLTNVLLLALVVVSVLVSAQWVDPAVEAWRPGTGVWASPLFQSLTMTALAGWSWWRTPPAIRAENHFTLHPLAEVVALFFGIFGALLPALAILQAHAAGIPLATPAHYFWATGALSAGLDNAPTYLSFASLAAAKQGLASNDLGLLAARAPQTLAAVSMGAVFMGAMTYLGNGPNLMVQSIARRAHAPAPSFGRYLLWSCGVLLPILALCAWVFL